MSLFNKLFISRYVQSKLHDLKPDHEACILDLGCGDKPYRNYYRKQFGKCVSMDYQERSGLDVRSDALSLPFKAGVFDFVLMTEVIEHLPDATLALQEVRRVLKPSGCLLLTWPFIHSLHEVPYDFQRLTEFGISDLARRCNLEIVGLARRGNALVVFSALLEFFGFGLLVALSRLPLVGRVFLPIHWGVKLILLELYKMCIWAFYGNFNSNDKPGEGLHGLIGHLRIWHLGYCACLRPIPRR